MNRAWLDRRIRTLASNSAALFLVFALFSLALRMATFGHPNIDSDEAYYFLVGQAMHEGSVPYVDLWDRKPFGLFALYYVFAGVSSSVLAYQIPAWLAVSGTCSLICEIGTRMVSPRCGILAGLIYPMMLPLAFGWGGQAPVFYNLPLAAAVCLVLRSLPSLQSGLAPRAVYAAMALCGLAVTIKQTAAFESAYLGLVGLWLLQRSGWPPTRLVRTASVWLLLGIGPTLLIAAFYWSSGHWHEFWQAVVVSNLAKQPSTSITLAARARDLYFRVGPLAGAALLGILLSRRDRGDRSGLPFLTGWMVAAALGFIAVPNFYPHYALPMLVPLSVAAGLFFARGWIGVGGVAAVAGYAAWTIDYFNWRYTQSAREQIASMAETIKEHGGSRGLLVFDGPVLLYRIVGQKPPSPLALPLHLNYAVEENVSHLRTNAEVARILAGRPGAVTFPLYSRNNPPNERAFAMVLTYVIRHCRLVDIENSSEIFRTDPIAVHGDCQ